MTTSLYTDCSSMQGSTTSSSSDMLTLTTAASSWCAIPASTRIRIVRLLRPHTRRILVTPGGIASYGFAVRGGKEFSTGFFVSSVDRNSEAEQKGLRIGDQILRVNGFRIDDAIHKEFVQLVSHQERLTLKVRSVGMLPVKDKDNDCLTWNVVKTPSISSTPSECSYQSSERTDRNHSRNQGDRVINVVLNVAPRTKLGLGICKGPEWKPGIFVQFTKEKSVAREAGLRPGDQILTVNSIDFSDVLFSEAVAVMKSSNKLDMTVHTGAGCDLFPGESSGYNSSASSVTGDQSPCWADVKSKRLTAVREESSTTANWNQPLYANERKCRSKSISERTSTVSTASNNITMGQTSFANTTSQPSTNKDINKTIIKLSENGATSINNTFISNHEQSNGTGTIKKSQGTTKVNEPSQEDSAITMEGTLTKLNQNKTSTNALPPPPPMADMLNHLQPHHHHHHHHRHHHHLHQPQLQERQHQHQHQHQQHHHHLNYSTDSLLTSSSKSSSSTTANSSSSNTYTKSKGYNADDDDGGIKIGGVAATMQRYQYANMQLAKMNKSSSIANGGDCSTYSNVNSNMESEKSSTTAVDAGGSLSSAITEELKKRKARRQPSALKEHNSHNSETKPMLQYETKRENHTNNHTISTNNNSSNSNNNSSTLNGNDFKNLTNNGNNNCNNTINSSNHNSNTLNIVGDQHSALMNEFKQAHKRMFKNGFKETAGTSGGGGAACDALDNRDRKEALLNTTILDDAGTCRSKSVKINTPQQSREQNDAVDSREVKQETYSNIPKPPPLQMANSNNVNNSNNSATYKVNNSPPSQSIAAAAQRLSNGYQNTSTNDNYSRPNKTTTTGFSSIPNGNNPQQQQTNRQTLRLGTVTIGEYRQQTLRREPEKFDFITNQKRNKDSGDTTPTNEALQSELQSTLSRANLRKSNGNSSFEHQRNCPLHQQQQQHLQQRRSIDCGSSSNSGGSGSGYTVEELSKKLQKSSINDNNNNNNGGGELLPKSNNRSVNNVTTGSTVSVGILKNGNGNRNGTSSSKSTEKSIKFG